jgi:phenylalanyl-tRNA synthetase alpha chain
VLPDEFVQELARLRELAAHELGRARDAASLEQARVAHLGMKGSVSRLFDRLPKLPPEQRRAFGQQANALKAELEAAHANAKQALERAGFTLCAGGCR